MGLPATQLASSVESRLGDDDGARRDQVLRQSGFIRRHVAGKGERAAGGGHVRGVDVVLERDRNAVQRTAQLALRALAIERVGFLERLRIHGQRRVQPVFVGRKPNQVLLDQLPRRDLSLGHRRLHLRDRRLDDGEALLAGGGKSEGRD